jgi:hypothetical protein
MFSRGKYGLRAARRDLGSLSSAERADAMQWYELVETQLDTFRAPSNYCWRTMLVMVGIVLETDWEDTNIVAASMAANLGYAARMVDVKRRNDLSEWAEDNVAEVVVRDTHGRADLESLRDDTNAKKTIAFIAQNVAEETFYSTARCAPAVWGGLTSLGAMQLHKNMLRQRVGTLRDLDAGGIAVLMRLGYILRCLDEAIGEEPGDPTTYSTS